MSAQPTLESVRQCHEDLERLQHLGAAALALSTGSCAARASRIPPEHKAHASVRVAEHLAAGLADAACARARALVRVYDAGGLGAGRADAREAGVALSEFYERLRDVKAVHRGDDGATWDGSVADAALVTEVGEAGTFSGEEGGGRYLDLQRHFAQYLNLVYPRAAANGDGPPLASGGDAKSKGGGKASRKRARGAAGVQAAQGGTPVRRIDYLEYVRRAMSDHGSVPVAVRNSRAYEHYLVSLLEYLLAFAGKLHPLAGVRTLAADAEASLRADLRKRLVSVRERFADAGQALEGMGAGGVRDELLLLGLKCGGRPADRAARLWQAADRAKRGAGGEAEGVVGSRVVAEGMVGYVLDEMLAEELRRTILNVEKKQSLSWVELEAERVAEEAVAERSGMGHVDGDEDEDDAEKALYNPKDVPLGWDGKPIPFWLYKLHGLNLEFRCEICGGTSYKGPRAFERHFTDAQHVHGLRCLEISYSKLYYMVTSIADAVKLRDKLREAVKLASFDADMEMEYEDASGNVLNRKTYHDLERQGLLQ
jgi:splicing factor 3A subunit 3